MATFLLACCLNAGGLPSANGAASPQSSAAETEAAATPSPAEESPAPQYPGLEEVAPRAAALASQAAEAKLVIERNDLAQELRPEVEALEEELAELEGHLPEGEEIETWPLSRLLEARASYLQLQRRQQALQKELAGALQTLEGLLSAWQADLAFWQSWQRSLQEARRQAETAAKITAPDEAFARSLNLIREVIASATDAVNRLLELQQLFSAQQERVASRIGTLQGAMENLRRETFRRNAYSLFNPAFYRQFSRETLEVILLNARSVLHIPGGFLREQGWIAVFQALAAILIGALLRTRRPRRQEAEDTPLFLVRHPWAGGIFLGLLIFAVFYTEVPPLWRWGQVVLIVIAATLLIVSLYRQALVRRIVRGLAGIYLLSETLALIGMPQPVRQVYLALLCLAVLVAFLVLARKVTSGRLQASAGLVPILFFGAALAGVGLIAELAGFATFAANWVEALLGTVILLLGTHMAIRLGDDAIAALLHKEWLRSRHFVQLLGAGTTRRLQNLLRTFILLNAFVYLFVVWNIFGSHKEAWTRLLDWGFQMGEFRISVQMLFLLLLVIYASSLISWLLQALLDAQFMTPRNMEFGVKTALKRLLHYALFTIGFFVAVSMAGIDLAKFTIIAGALGVGIGFGLQNIVNNFVSGLILLFERPVKVGDTINLDDQWGTISKIGLRSTLVETLDRAEIIVPNSELISQKVINWTLTTSVSRIVLPVGVAYGSRLDTVLAVLDRVGREHPDILDDPAPSAIFTGFGNSSIDFELRVWVGDINLRLKVKSELGQAIEAAFRREGITIPFPQLDLHVRSMAEKLPPSAQKS